MDAVACEYSLCWRPDSLRPASNPQRQDSGLPGETCAQLAVRRWAGTHDRDHHTGLPESFDAPDRVTRFRATALPGLVLFRAGANPASSAPSRLERTEALHRLLRLADRDIYPGEIVASDATPAGEPQTGVPHVSPPLRDVGIWN